VVEMQIGSESDMRDRCCAGAGCHMRPECAESENDEGEQTR
jgi:hypothetical protein